MQPATRALQHESKVMAASCVRSQPSPTTRNTHTHKSALPDLCGPRRGRPSLAQSERKRPHAKLLANPGRTSSPQSGQDTALGPSAQALQLSLMQGGTAASDVAVTAQTTAMSPRQTASASAHTTEGLAVHFSACGESACGRELVGSVCSSRAPIPWPCLAARATASAS